MVFAIEGISYPSHHWDDYTPDKLPDRFEYIQGMDAEWVSLGVVFCTTDKYSHDFHATAKTVSDTDLRNAIEDAHDAGLKVLLKPLLKMDNHQPPHEPTDIQAWFDGFTDWTVRYARIAEETGAEMFSIGNELSGVAPGNEEEWRALVDAVDAVYGGPIVYACQFKHMVNADFIWGLDGIDIIGLNNWFPVAAEDNKDPTVAEMQAAWYSADHFPDWLSDCYGDQSAMDVLTALAIKHGKPLLHTESGYSSRDGTASRPGAYNITPVVVDEQEQSDAFTAYFREWGKVALPSEAADQPVTADRFFLGTMLWEIFPGGASPAAGFSWEGKIAEGVIREQFETDAPLPQADSVVVEARGTAAFGAFPELQVLVDGNLCGTETVTGETETYTFVVPDLDTATSLAIRFANDARDPAAGADRNLIVTKVIAGGTELAITDAVYDRDGPAMPDMPGQTGLWWAGQLEFALEPPTPPQADSVVVEARGTAAFGAYPELQVIVDGNLCGTETVTGETETYTFAVPDLDTATSLAIRFPNDAYDPAAGADRNLIVTKVIAGGAELAITDAVYDRDGPAMPDIDGQTGLWWAGQLEFDLDMLFA